MESLFRVCFRSSNGQSASAGQQSRLSVGENLRPVSLLTAIGHTAALPPVSSKGEAVKMEKQNDDSLFSLGEARCEGICLLSQYLRAQGRKIMSSRPASTK